MLKEIDLATLEADLGTAGDTRSVQGPDADRWAVRTAVPRLVCEPSTPEDAAAALATCDRAGAGAIPWGGGTQQGLGSTPRRADVILRTGRLNRILEYEPADLTVTVEAGMTLAALQEALGRNGQWLATDPPVQAGATLGGLVATNINGPRRLRSGGWRDLVIGTRTANVDGTVTRAGGHVVKNVTGYDLNKAHVGGLGTLGILVELSLKVSPKPEMERSWFGVFQTAAAASTAMAALLKLPVPPAAIEILNHRTARAAGLAVLPGQWALLACASGFQPTVDRYLAEFEAAARAAGAIASEAMTEGAATDAWKEYQASAANLRWSAEALTCRIAIPPAQTGRLCDLLASMSDEPLMWAHCWGAIFWSQPEGSLPGNSAVIAGLRRAVEAAEGALVVENWPGTMVGVDVWGTPRSPLTIMQAIKKQYDPNGTINPGRYVGGI